MHDDRTNYGVVLAIVCVDWRMHHYESNFMQALYEYLGCDKIYVVTYPGPDGLCDGMEGAGQRLDFETVVRRARQVLAEHDIPFARKVLVAHSECAGHAADEGQHRNHARATSEALSVELGLRATVEPFIALKQEDDLHWKIEPC